MTLTFGDWDVVILHALRMFDAVADDDVMCAAFDERDAGDQCQLGVFLEFGNAENAAVAHRVADFRKRYIERRVKRRAFLYIKEDRNPQGIFVRSATTLLPLLYGVYYLSTGRYPESHEQVYTMFQDVRIPEMSKDNNVVLNNVNKYIESVTTIVNQVDAMKV